MALPMLLVYTVGIPAALTLAMHRRGGGTLQDHRAIYGYLFSGYTDQRWWFEREHARKALFVS